MSTQVFETQLMPDGHLACPVWISNKRPVRFKVIAFFDEPVVRDRVATDRDIEAAAVVDVSEDFLSDDEVSYYMALGDG